MQVLQEKRHLGGERGAGVCGDHQGPCDRGDSFVGAFFFFISGLSQSLLQSLRARIKKHMNKMNYLVFRLGFLLNLSKTIEFCSTSRYQLKVSTMELNPAGYKIFQS